MTALLSLLLLGLLLATVVPARLARATWVEREPVLALCAWQCLVVAVLLCCGLSLLLASAAALPGLRSLVFAGAPAGVEAAYGLTGAEGWGRLSAAVLAAGGVWTAVSLAREVRAARALRERRHAQLTLRAPELPAGLSAASPARERLVVLENVRPQAWSLPGPDARLVVTTGALQQLSDRELAAVLSHERGHVRARHHWLAQWAQALAAGFPGVGVFSAFRDQVGELVELAADDRAARRHGRVTTALALAELNSGVFFGSCPPGQLAQSPRRVDRLLADRPRLPVGHRLWFTLAALAAPVAALALAVAPGLGILL
ncbi:M56 family metallopeptidase [Kitasatospora paracochleata]|uniref:Zn-dependent protease with chaperone function n=1 Tax=Kitasatospora paracochleata TaxID=58354 RepID=A0ABT1J4E6_9ACTN|nr:M56 family metallopeptidase [Kitasatospora paracochleata]MCP2312297.1 Zn-dependent protease with chaperone function [Kitasatospora paracochleata]